MPHLSRRAFATLVGSAAVPLALRQDVGAADLSAQDVIDRVRKHIGVEWKPDTVDGLKAGDAATIVRGVVTTSMATLAVLQQAVKAGANFVITAQPTFYARTDSPTPPPPRGGGPNAAAAPDPVFAAKSEFITKNHLVVFRLSDHWRQRRPDPAAQGMADALGWTKYQSPENAERFDVPAVTLDSLASTVKKNLRMRGGIRVIGDPSIKVQRVGLLPGTTAIQASLRLLPAVDVIIAGEVREWESAEYVRDKAFAGERKGLILLGRVVSEEPGMDICARWVKTFLPEVPVRHIAADDPYWRPAS
jgi:putative NIF3 family GTP cyclohydrolase 1 type 2